MPRPDHKVEAPRCHALLGLGRLPAPHRRAVLVRRACDVAQLKVGPVVLARLHHVPTPLGVAGVALVGRPVDVRRRALARARRQVQRPAEERLQRRCARRDDADVELEAVSQSISAWEQR